MAITLLDSVVKLSWSSPLQIPYLFQYVVHVNNSNVTFITLEQFYEFNLSIGCSSTFYVHAEVNCSEGVQSEGIRLSKVSKMKCQQLFLG